MMSLQRQRVGLTRTESSRPGVLGLGLSALCSAVVLAAVGCVCALIYPVLKELRELRVRGQDGTEQRMLGFWSILALSLVVTCLCSTCSLFLTHLDSAHSMTRPQGLPQNSNGARLDYGMAVLNGVMAMFTVIWSLT
uniref:ADP-ribosylation factor-like protein 6-interacting protein 6 n=1 Tax=Neogobius melanostomus TaxID=47308 RepID=A0A8C6WSV0_9GOBI